MQMHRQSVDYSEASYCDRETYEDWDSRSSLTKSYPDEVSTVRTDSYAEELTSVRAERDSLVRALAAERQRAASRAAAQDARLAELHGVIAELMRRRTLDKQSNTILEEDTDRSDDCDSSTQPAGELDNDEHAENGDPSSQCGAADLPTPDDANITISEDTESDSSMGPPPSSLPFNNVKYLGAEECCGEVGSSCERLRGSVALSTPGGSEFRQAKLASRVKLRRTEDVTCRDDLTQELQSAAERLTLDVCAAADVREAAVAGNQAWWGCVVARLRADLRVSQAVAHRAQDQANRLQSVCAQCSCACYTMRDALASADRALECYDSILALWETRALQRGTVERATAEAVATQLLSRLESNEQPSDLLSPGPWLDTSISSEVLPYDEAVEARLRSHAARLKAETVSLRDNTRDIRFSYHDSDNDPNVAEMEEAIAQQELCVAAEKRAEQSVRAARGELSQMGPVSHSSRREKKKHWIETQETSETDL